MSQDPYLSDHPPKHLFEIILLQDCHDLEEGVGIYCPCRSIERLPKAVSHTVTPSTGNGFPMLFFVGTRSIISGNVSEIN